MNPLKIYVAGPISAPTHAEVKANAERAIDAGIRLIYKGHHPFVPHLSVWTNVLAQQSYTTEISWQTWMDIDDVFLQCCDALLYLGSSRGADIELARAKELGLKIYYSVEEVPVAEVDGE